MATAKTAKRPTEVPEEPTPEQIKALLNFVLASNKQALRALAYR